MKGSAFNRKVLGWSAGIGLPLFLLPVLVANSRNPWAEIQWYHYEFLDKRWLFVSYVVATVVLLFIPAVVSRFLRVSEEGDVRPLSEESARAESEAESQTELRANKKIPLFKPLTLLGLCFLAAWLWGPPWKIDELVRKIELHELVHTGALQAIHLGRIPYAQAQVQYGPGLQYLSYLYLKLTQFDLVHLRESFALLNFLGALVIFAGFSFLLPAAYAWGAALFAAVSASPLGFYEFGPTRVLEGFYGWGNPWRYLGILALVGSFHLLYWRVSSPRLSRVLSFFAGFGWGIFTWISQENLASGVTAFGLYISLMAATGPKALRELALQVLSVIAGFAGLWAIVVAYYAAHSVLADFFRNYFMVSGLVTQGFSNTPFKETYWKLSYIATPYLAWALAIAAMWNRRTGRVFDQVDENQALVLAGAAMVLGGYQNALFRADGGHYTITQVGLPLLIFSGLRLFPEKPAFGWLRVAIFAGLTVLYPIRIPLPLRPAQVSALMTGWVKGLARHTRDQTALAGAAVPQARGSTVGTDLVYAPASLRFGPRFGLPLDLHEGCCHSNSGSLREFFVLMNEFNNYCGSRPAVVDSFVDFNGYVYFFADLNPALNYTENHHFLFNSLQVRKYHELLDQTEYRCVIGTDPRAPAFEIFRQKHPGFEEREFFFSGRKVTVLRGN